MPRIAPPARPGLLVRSAFRAVSYLGDGIFWYATPRLFCTAPHRYGSDS